jgi:hexulose-6-phosphate isomerase
MGTLVNRRDFLSRSASVTLAGALLGAGRPRTAAAASKISKAASIDLLPRNVTVLERFQMAKEAGFEGIEPQTLNSADEVRQYKEAAEKTGVRIHSIMNADHWKFPLTDNDPEVVKKCVAGIETSLHNAHELGADTVLLVPGIVNGEVGYAEVYKRSQEQIRKLIPLAKDLKVIIAVEDVGNRFLLSPLEFARYVDELKSPWVKAYFDIGNIVTSGYPQDWIRILGPRIVKLHIKRFEPGTDHPKYDPKDRRNQGVDWPAVRKALSEVGYNGWISVEVRSGDAAYLKEINVRLDRILAGQQPV